GGRLRESGFLPSMLAECPAARGLRILAAAVVLLAGSSRAAAQGLPGSIEVGGGAGRFFGGAFAAGSTRLTDKKADADDDILRGFWLAAQLTRAWGVEVAV